MILVHPSHVPFNSDSGGVQIRSKPIILQSKICKAFFVKQSNDSQIFGDIHFWRRKSPNNIPFTRFCIT